MVPNTSATIPLPAFCIRQINSGIGAAHWRVDTIVCTLRVIRMVFQQEIEYPDDPYEFQDAICACACDCVNQLNMAEERVCTYCNIGIHVP
jgi:hypothetical protein